MSDEKPGFYSTLEMLRGLEPAHQERLLADVAARDPELADKLRAQMFSFDDLAHVNAGGLREIVKLVQESTLARSLRACADPAKQALLSALSERAQSMLLDTMQVMGPQPLSKVQDAQKEILDLAVKLESEGKIVLRESSDDPLV